MRIDDNIYELLLQERIEELKSDGFLLRHKKSGARIAVLSNDDENKVFSIGFRTPPPNSSGVPHILEHSVLCGSAKYPVKDPFIELAKGSLNTFLNAMTFPDKTVYPVASCNDADFKNLTDVYMDAVLNPNIYKHKEIFMQEGWHYELENEEDELKVNGVVYNEMKGVFSSPEDVLSEYCMNSLYPQTEYAVVSGGDPKEIPKLTYEDFVGFHQKLYHPSNSYIYIYGDCDMEERLEYLDREYLSKYDYLEVDSQIKTQEAFEEPVLVTAQYSVTEDEGTEDRTFLSLNLSVGDSLDKYLYVAFPILDYALFSAPGAPVKQALIDAGIGEDVYSCYENDLKQPMFCIVAKNTNADRKEEFLSIIMETLAKLAQEGINKDTLLAGINSFEFEYREADAGRTPKGLIFGIDMLGSWLYDDMKPFINFKRNEVFAFLRDNIENGYFERLIEQYFLNNTHRSLVVLCPSVNLSAREDEELKNTLSEYKKSLTEAEIKTIVRETKQLKEYQQTQNTEEELKSIPLLTREDIRKTPLPIKNEEVTDMGAKVFFHDYYTNGIGYVSIEFNADSIPACDIPYCGLLTDVFGYIDTQRHTYEELSNLTDINTGGITSVFSASRKNKTGDVKAKICIKSKSLFDKFKLTFDLILEEMFEAKYDDFKRLKEIIAEVKSGLGSKITSAGHSMAKLAANAQFSEQDYYIYLAGGIGYYDFLCDIYENFDEKKELVAEKLFEISRKIFAADKLLVSYTSDREGLKLVKPQISEFISKLPEKGAKSIQRKFERKNLRLGIKTSSQVNYVARCGQFCENDEDFDASLNVFKTMLSYDYLWTNIRVLGGAYGCMAGFERSGQGGFMSYRDPNVGQTNVTFEGIYDYAKDFKASEREMTKYIIGTFSNIDMPLSPRVKGERSMSLLENGTSLERLQMERTRMINTQPSDINALAPYIEKLLSDTHICVIGNKEKIEQEKELFDEIRGIV